MTQTKTVSTTFKKYRMRRDREVGYGEPCKSVDEECSVTLTGVLTLSLDLDKLFDSYAAARFQSDSTRFLRSISMRDAKDVLVGADFKASLEGPITRTQTPWVIIRETPITEFSEAARIRSGLSRDQAHEIYVAHHRTKLPSSLSPK